jgi:hypothetical protein
MRLCIDCKHFNLAHSEMKTDLGRCVYGLPLSMVDGKPHLAIAPFADHMRRNMATGECCGTEAIFWEQKHV